MTLLAGENLHKKFNEQVIFSGASFTVQSGDRIGLVGPNGSGKTTLFELISGRMSADVGTISKAKSCLVDYIEQEKHDQDELSLFEYVATARRDLLEIRRRITALENELATNPENPTGVKQLGQLQQKFEIDGGFNFESDVDTILHGLGFEKHRYDDSMRNFSGGEKNRAALARVLAGKGNLLLMDEPTNHLDIESTAWLEQYLHESNKSYIVVSHDRAFLTATTEKIWETTHGKLDLYPCGFEKYMEERKERRRLHAHRFRHQQEEIKRLEDFVQRNMAGQKTKQAQSKLKFLGRIKRLPPPGSDGTGPTIAMSSSGRSYAHVIAVENVSIGFGSTTVLRNIHFDVYRGDKIGLIGRNGSGKTTLLRSLIGELAPTDGDIKLGNNVDVAYFDQELSDLNLDSTVIDSLWQLDPAADVGRIRSFLARFGFTGDDALKIIRSLSGGEKTKLSLARLLYYPANFIILDEPTNHLDIDSREALEQALNDYDGSCLIVSHDRYFLDRVATKIIHADDGTTSVYDGDYSYFKEKTTKATITVPKQTKSKKAYHAFKEESKRRARHKKAIVSTKSKIADHEKELTRLEQAIGHNIPRNDWEELHTAGEKKKEIETALLELYATLEELEQVKFD